MPTDRKVAITGIGVVTPVGNNLQSFWESISNGRSGAGRITCFDLEGHDCHIAAEVKDFDATPFFNKPKDIRRTDRYSQFAMAAAKMAMEDSGLDLDSVDRDRFGVIVGSGIGGLKSLSDQMFNLFSKGPNRISPFMIPMMIANMASGLIAIEYGLRGANYAPVSACASACHAIGEAYRMIKYGENDFFLCGGAEATIVPIGVGGFASMKALSTRNDDPQRASRPFDVDRDGFVMGEGGGVILLEEMEHAKRRGARIYGELSGYGLTCDAYHMTSPAPDGASRCMQMALDRAGVLPSEVDYINAHGTSTPLGDISETNAIKSVFGDYAKNGLLVSSTKSMTGHLLGAAGAVEMAACLMAMRDGIVPPTINLDNPDPECDLDYVPHTAREKKVRTVVNNSFGFGGHNATLVVKAFEG